ncbi:MAG: PAS domain-containing protein [Gammaproteobacteria bacterium]|nr:PAS domain-containing protein [Gammaproteobacteria bacterium]
MNPNDYARILEHLNTAVVLTDRALAVMYMNPAAEALLGTSLRMAQHLEFSQIHLNIAAGDLASCVQRSLASGHDYTYRELTLQLPNGQECTVDCSITPIYEGAIAQRVLIELNPIDRILRIAREEQRIAQNATIHEMARGLAHEINNPLGGLRGAAQLLERELSEDAKEYTQIIIQEADRLRALVRNMLGPNTRPDKTTVNIHEVLQHVMRLIIAEAGAQLRFIQDYDPSIPEIWADRGQLIQATLNIVRNAWQATGDSGVITFRTRALRAFTIGRNIHRLVLRLDIIDNGSGIPTELAAQIFYPMVTGRSEGTGLGLTIAQSLLQLHDGLIECQSEPGRTQFTFFIPINRTQDHITETQHVEAR